MLHPWEALQKCRKKITNLQNFANEVMPLNVLHMVCQNVSATSQEGSSPTLQRHAADGTFVHDRGILIQTSQTMGDTELEILGGLNFVFL